MRVIASRIIPVLLLALTFCLSGCGGGGGAPGASADQLESNIAPIANAGAAQSVITGTVVTLDGSASSDENGDLLTYSWAITSKPSESAAALSKNDIVNPTFIPDTAGVYVFSLAVHDGKENSAAATVTVTASVGNAAPVANAGITQHVVTGTPVTLDGSGSSDADGDLLIYSWALTSRPGGSAAALSGAAGARPSFTPDLAGSYIFSLVVSDGKESSAAATATVIATASDTNAAPVAHAGVAQSVVVGKAVTLDGSGSSDANGDLLTFGWAFTSKPGGSGAGLSSATAVHPTFTPDVAGAYVIRLIVNDGKTNSAAASVLVTASTASVANAAPVADAGSAQNVNTGSVVTLDGSGSSDADGDLLSFSWAFSARPNGSIAALSGPARVNPAFTPDVAGAYVVRLIVNDGKANSAAATVVVTASTASANAAPVANAGSAQNVDTGSVVTLDGSGSSDADGDLLSFSWAFSARPNGSAAALSGPAAVNPTFTPDVAGAYVIRLIVSDGKANSAAATVTVTATATAANAAPVANAGSAQNVNTGSAVTLDGSGSSDADGDLLKFSWTFTAKPGGSVAALSGAATAGPTFTPDAAGSYVFSLIVNDGKANSAAATVTVTATATAANAAPVADAGVAQSVSVGTVVTLDASGSSDANGDLLTYDWIITSKPNGSNAQLSSAVLVNPKFTPDVAGAFVFRLIVNDGKANSAAATVTVTATATAANAAPVANAGAAQNVNTGSVVTLDGSGSSDADGDLLNYSWTCTARPNGSAAALSGATAANPTFTPDLAGSYVFSLVVSDGRESSAAAAVTVTATAPATNAAPVAHAGSAQSVIVGTVVTLDGSGSSDADHDQLTYKWAFTSRPDGSQAALSITTAVKPAFTPDVAGTYVLNLVVNDGRINSAAATVNVTATAAGANAAPVAQAGTGQSVVRGTVVTLDGSGSSDADGDPLTYKWAFTSKPAGSNAALSSTVAVKPAFTPDAVGTYVLNLVVNDGKINSAASTVSIISTTDKGSILINW